MSQTHNKQYSVLLIFAAFNFLLPLTEKHLFFFIIALCHRPADEQAEGIRPGHSLQHRLSRTLPVTPAVCHSQAARQEGGVFFRGS